MDPEDRTVQPTEMQSLDAVTAAGEYHSVLLENDRVRVLDTCIGPGRQTPVHTHHHPASLYVLGWSDFIRYDRDGNVLLDSRSMPSIPVPGEAIWTGPLGPHYVKNVGSTDLRVIAVELKTP